eukprot:458109_1
MSKTDADLADRSRRLAAERLQLETEWLEVESRKAKPIPFVRKLQPRCEVRRQRHAIQRILKAHDVMQIDFGTQVDCLIFDCCFTMSFDPKYDDLMSIVKEATNMATRSVQLRAKWVGGSVWGGGGGGGG